jgi:hypothetical protein
MIVAYEDDGNRGRFHAKKVSLRIINADGQEL